MHNHENVRFERNLRFVQEDTACGAEKNEKKKKVLDIRPDLL